MDDTTKQLAHIDAERTRVEAEEPVMMASTTTRFTPARNPITKGERSLRICMEARSKLAPS